MELYEFNYNTGGVGVVMNTLARSKEEAIEKFKQMTEIEVSVNGVVITVYLYPSELPFESMVELLEE